MDKSIEQMGQDLAFGPYAKSTQKSYLRSAKALAGHFDGPVEKLKRDDLRGYVEHLREQSEGASWLKMELGALVFLFAKTLGRPEDVSFVSWPRQHSPLPLVLSQQEVGAFIEALRHPVFRAIAMVLYGAGLRLAEALSLELPDIDGSRGVLRVRHGKGDRAREARLSPALLQYLRGYWDMERPLRPYLFVSRRTGGPPTQESVRRAFRWPVSRLGSPSR